MDEEEMRKRRRMKAAGAGSLTPDLAASPQAAAGPCPPLTALPCAHPARCSPLTRLRPGSFTRRIPSAASSSSSERPQPLPQPPPSCVWRPSRGRPPLNPAPPRA